MTEVAPLANQRTVELDGVPPFKINVHPEDDIYISHSILQHGVWEPCETKALIKLLAADTDFIDVGANIGWYTMLAAATPRNRGMVHAFEPEPSNFALLAQNISLNQITNAFCHNAGVSDHSAGARLFLHTTNKGDHRLYDSSDGRESLDVRTISLDEYREINASRSLIIKLDTQGSEVRILRGASNLLANHPEEIVLICEFWPFGLGRNGSSAAELTGLISNAGFEPFIIGDTRLLRADWASLLARAEGGCAPATELHVDFVAFRPGSKMLPLVMDMME